jgi:hypothetical protein
LLSCAVLLQAQRPVAFWQIMMSNPKGVDVPPPTPTPTPNQSKYFLSRSSHC